MKINGEHLMSNTIRMLAVHAVEEKLVQDVYMQVEVGRQCSHRMGWSEIRAAMQVFETKMDLCLQFLE